MSALAVMERLLTQLRRNPFTLVVLVGMPTVMILAFWFAFSGTGLASNTTYTLIVVNNDEGVTTSNLALMTPFLPAEIPHTQTLFSEGFVDLLNTTSWPGDNETTIFNVQLSNDELDAREKVEGRTVDALIILPPDFSNTSASAVNQGFYTTNRSFIPGLPQDYNSTIQMIGDEGFINFVITRQVVELFLESYHDQLMRVESPVSLETQISEVTVQSYSIFDTTVPGAIVFGLLSQGGMMGALLTAEVESPYKTLTRIRLSLIKPFDYLLGATLAQVLVVAPVQLATLYGISLLLGFSPEGNLIEGFLACWSLSLFSLSLTFFTASLFSNPETAGSSVGFLVTPLAFASGAFIDVPPVVLIENIFPTASGGLRDFLLWDLLPSTHVVNATRVVLLYKSFGLGNVLPDLLFALALSLLLFLGCVLFYAKRRFSGDM